MVPYLSVSDACLKRLRVLAYAKTGEVSLLRKASVLIAPMKTHVRQEDLKVGRVYQVCGKAGFVRAALGNQGNGRTVQLYFSHLRSVTEECQQLIFATGCRRRLKPGDRVVIMQSGAGYRLWGLKDEYEQSMATIPQVAEPSPIPVTAEMEKATIAPLSTVSVKDVGHKTGEMASHDRIAEFYRRYPAWRPRNGVTPVPI